MPEWIYPWRGGWVASGMLRPAIQQGVWLPHTLAEYAQYIDFSRVDIMANRQRQTPGVLNRLQTTIIASMETDLAISLLIADMGVV